VDACARLLQFHRDDKVGFDKPWQKAGDCELKVLAHVLPWTIHTKNGSTLINNTHFNRSSRIFPGGYEPFNTGPGCRRDDGVTRINLLLLIEQHLQSFHLVIYSSTTDKQHKQ
jgi:hypothetical protein